MISYGINLRESNRRAAAYVDKILNGSKPGDLPVEFPTKLELVINLKTAKALGLTVPPSLLARSDELIEWTLGVCMSLFLAQSVNRSEPPGQVSS